MGGNGGQHEDSADPESAGAERKDRTKQVRDLGPSAAAVVKGGRHRQRKDDDGPTVTWDLTENKS